jgi:hypothetical protein
VPRLIRWRDRGAHYREFRSSLADAFPRGLPAEPGRSAFVAFGSDWTPVASGELPGPAYLTRLHRGLMRRRLA